MPLQQEITKALLEAEANAQCATGICDVDYGLSGFLMGKAAKPSLKNNLQGQLAHHEEQAKRLKRLITLLDANPEVREILELSKSF